MLRYHQGNANEARLREYEEQLQAADDANQDLHTTITNMRRRLMEALEGGNPADAPEAIYNLVAELLEGDYWRAREEVEQERREGSAKVAASERARDIGHKYVATLTSQAFSRQALQTRYADAEEVMSQILQMETRLIQQGRLNRRSILNSQMQYCSILCQLASFEKSKNRKAAKELLKRAAPVYRSIWELSDEAQSLSETDGLVLDSGHKLGLVLAELAELTELAWLEPDEDQLRLAEIQFKEVWNARKKALTLGPTHNDTVDSALQLVSTLERQTKLDEKRKRAEIEGILRDIWSRRGARLTARVQSCGHKLGEQLYQQEKYCDAATVLNEVWMARKGAIVRGSKEGNDARSTGYLLAGSLYYHRTKEKYEHAQSILLKLWERRRDYMSPKASPPNDFIGWRLAWTYRMLKDYQRAESIFQAIWEARKIDRGADHARTLCAQYELAFTQVLGDRWATAQPNFQYIWERRKQGIDGELENENTVRLNSGHYLGTCLLRQKCYRAAVAVLTELHHRRALALGEDAEETKLTLQELEKAKKALALQTKQELEKAEKAKKALVLQKKALALQTNQEKKAGAERARVEARKQEKKQERKLMIISP